MVVDHVLEAADPRCLAALDRIKLAGYEVDPSSTKVELIHCKQGGHAWEANGFCQTYLTLPTGQRCRVLDYAPDQRLQPHVHDMDELFVITGGSVFCHKWPEGLDAAKVSCQLRPGDKLEVPAGTPHALVADPVGGVQFHEIVGDFGKRGTDFFTDLRITETGEGVEKLSAAL